MTELVAYDGDLWEENYRYLNHYFGTHMSQQEDVTRRHVQSLVHHCWVFFVLFY
jgi:hypothetical protein